MQAPTPKQERVAKALLEGNHASKAEALRAAGYSPVTAKASAARTLATAGVTEALQKLRGRKRVSARNLLDAALPKVLAAIDRDPELALKAVAVASQTLRNVGDDSSEIEATQAARDLAYRLRVRSMFRVLRFALRNPDRANRLAEAIGSRYGLLPDEAEIVVESEGDQ